MWEWGGGRGRGSKKQLTSSAKNNSWTSYNGINRSQENWKYQRNDQQFCEETTENAKGEAKERMEEILRNDHEIILEDN